MGRIIWHSCAPWSPSLMRLRNANSDLGRAMVKMGHEVVISNFWGLNGGVTQWEGMTVLPASAASTVPRPCSSMPGT